MSYKNWTQGRRGVAVGVSIAVIVFGLRALQGHFAQAADSHAATDQNTEMLEQVVLLVTELGERAKAEDVATEQDKKRCLQGKIVDLEICGAAGVEPAL